MDNETLNLLNELNKAIIRFRGMYSEWSNARGVSYHEMLVYYTIREYGYCTQKLICESYLLPKQTINNVFAGMRKNGILEQGANKDGREKVFVLTEKGRAKYSEFMAKLDDAENAACDIAGRRNLARLKDLFLKYDRALEIALGGNGTYERRQNAGLGNGKNK